jgi:signal peptidase I
MKFVSSRKLITGRVVNFLALAIIATSVWLHSSLMRVSGASMESTIWHGEYILADRVIWDLFGHFGHAIRLQRGQLVVCQPPSGPLVIKRIAAIGGDLVKVDHGRAVVTTAYSREASWESAFYQVPDQSLRAGNTQVLVSRDFYYLVGDNSSDSVDSRMWGPVPRSRIIALVLYVFHSPRIT